MLWQTKENEYIEKDPWCWEARFKDGSELKQFGDDGKFHYFAEINQVELAFFTMTNGLVRHVLVFDQPHMKLISFVVANIIQRWNAQAKVIDSIEVKRYCFGYETKISGVVHTVLNVIMPDGSIITTDDVNKIQIG